MKRAFPLALCLIFAAGTLHASSKPIPRKWAGATLGMTLAQAKKRLKAYDAPKMIADIALPGEKIMVLSGVETKAAGKSLGAFRDGKLRRVEWTYKKNQVWDILLKAQTKRLGAAQITHPKANMGTQDVYAWSDGKTRLDLTRSPRPEGLAIYGSMEDIPLTEAAYKAFAAEAKDQAAVAALKTAPAPSEASAQCLDYGACYNIADQHAKAGHCAEAIKLYSRAIELKPDRPWAWYHRAVLRRALGDEAGAKEDYAEALERKNNDTDTLKKPMQNPKDVYGASWACLP